jgi:hypothetical protein
MTGLKLKIPDFISEDGPQGYGKHIFHPKSILTTSAHICMHSLYSKSLPIRPVIYLALTIHTKHPRENGSDNTN